MAMSRVSTTVEDCRPMAVEQVMRGDKAYGEAGEDASGDFWRCRQGALLKLSRGHEKAARGRLFQWRMLNSCSGAWRSTRRPHRPKFYARGQTALC